MKAIDKFNSDPDSIDIELMNSIVPGNMKNQEYDLVITLVGQYKKHSEESQVKTARDNLKKITTKLEKAYEKDKKKISDEIKLLDKMMESYVDAQSFLENYSDQVYVKEDELLSLYEVLSSLGADDSIVKFFLSVAKNNAAIEIEAAKAREAEKETEIDPSLEEMKSAHASMISNVYDTKLKDSLFEKKQQIMIRYRNFLKNHEYMPDELFEQVARILDNIEELVNDANINEMDNSFIAENDFDMIECYEDEKELLLAFVTAILKSHDDEDVLGVSRIIESYKRNPIITPDKILYAENRLEESDILSAAAEIKESHLERGNYNQLSSYSTLSDTETIEENLKHSNIDSIEFVKFTKEKEIMSLFDNIEGNIRNRNLEYDLDSKIEELNSLIIDYNELDELNEEMNKDNKENGLYGEGFENYVVFLDPEVFVENYQNMVNSHAEKLSSSSIQTPFSKLTKKDIVDLQNIRFSKNIHTGKGTPNSYSIKDLTGRYATFGYKVLECGKFNNHHVIVVILPSYRYADGNKRSKALRENIKLYEQNIEKYKELERIFSNNATPEEQQRALQLIEEGIEMYDKLTSITKGKGSDLT